MHDSPARRHGSRFGLALGIGASSALSALGGALLLLHSLPVSAPVEPASIIAPRPVVTVATTSVPSAPPRPPTPRVALLASPAPRTTAPTTAAPPTTIAPPAPAAAPASAPVHLVAASSAPLSAGAFAFEVHSNDGSPARWDPCTPIHYVLNLTAAPPGAVDDVNGALARVSAATGMTFIADGSTSELPSRARPNEEPARYGHRWAPLLIAWVHTGATDYLSGDRVLGEGGATWVAPLRGDDVFVTGQVAIDAETTAPLAAGFGAGATLGLLLLHEFGHAMGLAHVSDQSEVMFPSLQPKPVAAYGRGDLAGLRALGTASGCDPAPAAS